MRRYFQILSLVTVAVISMSLVGCSRDNRTPAEPFYLGEFIINITQEESYALVTTWHEMIVRGEFESFSLFERYGRTMSFYVNYDGAQIHIQNNFYIIPSGNVKYRLRDEEIHYYYINGTVYARSGNIGVVTLHNDLHSSIQEFLTRTTWQFVQPTPNKNSRTISGSQYENGSRVTIQRNLGFSQTFESWHVLTFDNYGRLVNYQQHFTGHDGLIFNLGTNLDGQEVNIHWCPAIRISIPRNLNQFRRPPSGITITGMNVWPPVEYWFEPFRVGGHAQLSAHINIPGDIRHWTWESVTWHLSDTSIAEIYHHTGGAVDINFLTAGEVTITARSVANPNVSFSRTITIEPPL